MSLDIDLDRSGRHVGAIRISASVDDSAYRQVQIPIASLRHGEGPRIVCMGGNHGDEFEGQIIWSRILRELPLEMVTGQLIIVPAINLPAALAGRRTSPMDGGNLNRLFPGDPAGSVTQRIAHIVETELIRGSDFLIDIHSGGNSLIYAPGPSVTYADDPRTMARRLEMLRAFGGAVGYVFADPPTMDVGTTGACRRHGVERLGTELGGGGTVSPGAVALGLAGAYRALVHLGALKAEAAPPSGPEPMRILRRGSPSGDGYVYAEEDGLFEPTVELGREVRRGDLVGWLHDVQQPWRAPLPVASRAAGIVICRRAQGRAVRGDGLLVLGQDI